MKNQSRRERRKTPQHILYGYKVLTDRPIVGRASIFAILAHIVRRNSLTSLFVYYSAL